MILFLKSVLETLASNNALEKQLILKNKAYTQIKQLSNRHVFYSVS